MCRSATRPLRAPLVSTHRPSANPVYVPWRRLHDVEPLEGLEMLPPAQLSRLVAAKALRTVPYPLLGENTLVISDSVILAPDDTGQLALMVRCAHVIRPFSCCMRA